MAIVADVYERRSGMIDALEAHNVAVEIAALSVGDYRIGTSLVERKTVYDLHSTLRERRLWTQLANLRSTGLKPYLLVEGRSLDVGPLADAAIRGALLIAMDQRVRVLRALDVEEAALWLIRIAQQRHRRPSSEQSQTHATTDPASVLACVRGLGPRTARTLLDEFGTIAAVVRAEPQELARVRGIGPRRASVLHEVLTRSQPHRDREGLAT
jgi:DNA excision repair protein ERCC-4